MKGLTRAYDGAINLMRVLSGILIFIVFVLICLEVLTRSTGLQPWIYSTIIVEYSFLWFAMLAAPHLVRTKGHVFIDALMILLPQRYKVASAKISYIICITASCVFAWYSGVLLVDAIQNNLIDFRAEEVPMWLLYVPIPVGFVFVATEFMRYVIGPDSMYGERTEVRDNV